MKKYIFIPYANLAIGGVPTKIIDIANTLEKTHPDTIIKIFLQKRYVNDQRALITNPNTHVADFTYPLSLGKKYAYIIWLWGNILWCRPVTILAFLSPYALPSLLAKKIFFWLKIRVVVSEDHYTQTMLERMAAPWIQRTAINLLYPSADMIITPTVAIQKQLAQLCKISKNRMVVIPNWTKLSERPLKKTNRHWDIIHIGRLVPSKKPMKIVRVMKRYINAHPNAKCAIVGEGEELSNMLKFIKTNRLSHNLKLFPATSDVSKYLLYAKTFLFLPEQKTEGFPIVLLEAMACGTVVVSTKFDGAIENLIHLKNGYVCNTTTKVLTTIVRLIIEPPTLQWLQRVKKIVTLHNSMKNCVKYINSLNVF